MFPCPTFICGNYKPRGAFFDGVNDYMARGAELTGLADGKAGLVSLWANLNGGNGSFQYVIAPNTGNFAVRRNNSNKWQVLGFTSAAATVLDAISSSSFTASSGWHHVLVSWDANATIAQMYINGVADLGSGGTPTNAIIDYVGSGNFFVGCDSGNLNRFNGGLADLFFNDAYLDLSVPANVAKFINNGKPVNLGVDGAIPLGFAPKLYVRGPSANFNTNLGTGGNFTVTGALTDTSTNPGD